MLVDLLKKKREEELAQEAAQNNENAAQGSVADNRDTEVKSLPPNTIPDIPESSDEAGPAQQPEQHEHHGHIEYSDQQIERAHEALGISGRPYLILESDAAKFAERGINIDEYLKQHDTSFFAPGAIPNLFKKNKWCQVRVDIGPNSNVQEIGKMTIAKGQKVNINIGAGSSLAHGVKLAPSDRAEVNYQIGDNVFIGIGTYVSECEIGNNCSIGFKCRLENDVMVGDFVTVCDGAIIKEGVDLKPFTVVPPGLVVNQRIAAKPPLSPAEYVKLAKNLHETVENLIQFTPEEQEAILAAEEQEKGRGNLIANRILENAGVDASSLFLTRFNKVVVSENRLFPLMYRLIGKFHPEHQENSDRSSQASKYGNNVQIVDLPVNRTAFIKHYMDQVEQGKKEEEIIPYNGPFTSCQVDWDQVRLEGDTHLIGPVEIKGDTVIGQHFVSRFDEGEPQDTLTIDECTLGENITIHASGSKYLKSVEAGNDCVFHGREHLVHCALGESIILHNVLAKESNLHGNSILLAADLDNVTIGERNTIIGHRGQIDLKNVNTGREVVVLHNVKVLGGERQPEDRIWLGNSTKIRENTYLYGEGQVKRNQVLGPNGIFEVLTTDGLTKIRQLEQGEASELAKTKSDQWVQKLVADLQQSLNSQMD